MSNLQPLQPLRLRERLMTMGAKQLSDAELLAIFISSGTKNKSCLQLAYELLNKFGDLRAILNAELKQFNAIKGIGVVRFLQLKALGEIYRRSDFIYLQKNTQLNNTAETHRFIKRQLRDRKNETVIVLFLDSQHRVIHYEELFQGTVNAANIHIRSLIERTLTFNAAALILAHNHPSGISDASPEDILVTQQIKAVLDLIDVKLLDHLIIGDNEIYSITNQIKWPCH